MVIEKISLRDFVRDALDEICCAVEEAQKSHSVIAPKNESYVHNIRDTSSVEFDLAIEITERQNYDIAKENSLNAGVEVKTKLLSVISMKSSVSRQLSDKEIEAEESIRSSQNRIKFSVPIYFQYDVAKRLELDKHNKNLRNTPMKMDSGSGKI